jgi:hypothetical protein
MIVARRLTLGGWADTLIGTKMMTRSEAAALA